MKSTYNSYDFSENNYLYTFPEERRDWREKIEKQIEDAEASINENIDEAETNIVYEINEAKNDIKANVNQYVIEAKNEIKENDNANKDTIISQLKSWLNIR